MAWRYGLIGHPLTHSFSPAWFNGKFRREGSAESYAAYPLESLSGLPALLDAEPDLRGLNVTIPHKERILPYLDTLSPEAAAIGAVNCIRITGSGAGRWLQGFNTDWKGFLETIPPAVLRDRPEALVFGNGGAARAVRFALTAAGIPYRTVSRRGGSGDLELARVDRALLRETHFLINTTPLGTFPHTAECLPLPYDALTPEHVLYDLVYNPPLTRFLEEGQNRGCTVINGYRMLCLQADESLGIWRETQDLPDRA